MLRCISSFNLGLSARYCCCSSSVSSEWATCGIFQCSWNPVSAPIASLNHSLIASPKAVVPTYSHPIRISLKANLRGVDAGLTGRAAPIIAYTVNARCPGDSRSGQPQFLVVTSCSTERLSAAKQAAALVGRWVMRFLVNRWRRIGTRLYLALGFAVLLTLVSSAVGVYYFERSGDLNYQVRSESVPALEATWSLAHESERLRVLGLGLLVEPGSGSEYVQTGSVDESLERLETALATVGGVQALAPHVSAVQDAAYGLAEVIDELAVHRDVVLDANAAEADLRARLGEISGDPGSAEVAAVLGLTLRADDEKILQDLWDKFAGLTRNDVDTALGERVYVVRGQQLALRSRSKELAMAFDEASAVLDGSVSGAIGGCSHGVIIGAGVVRT